MRMMDTEHTFNSYSGSFPRLVDLQDLSPSRKELILSHCGFPRTDASKDGRTDLGTGKLPVVSAPGFSHRMSRQQTGHNLETGCPQSPETPLSKIMNLMRNGNKQDLQRYLENMYSDHCVFRQTLGHSPLSHSRFFADLRQRLKRLEQNGDLHWPH